mmetsp:Transcript_68931/g.224637  ORF Transcript_68931/g.224637 Transcript_68931/m.224637 type:complete len:366 (-) Transcript_68931:149-1246(-)
MDWERFLPGTCHSRESGKISCQKIWPGLFSSVGARPWPRFEDGPDALAHDGRFRCGFRNESVLRSVARKADVAAACSFRGERWAYHLQRAPDLRYPSLSSGSARSSIGELVFYVALPSAPGEAENRQAVRASWAAWALRHKRPWSYDFFVGAASLEGSMAQSLRQEAKDFGDIVLLDMVDSYNNLTLKVVQALAHAHRVIQPRFLVRLNSNNRLQPRRLVDFLGKLSDDQVGSLYPNGFMWTHPSCMNPLVLEEITCQTLTARIPKAALVYNNMMLYPSGQFLVSSSALGRMMEVYSEVVRQHALLPPGSHEDCFMGYLATAAGVPILNFSPDGTRLFHAHNCSRGFTLLDESVEELGQPRRGCW